MAAFDIPRVRSNPTHEKQNDEDDQNNADDTDAAMTVAEPSAEATTETTKQENDEEDDEMSPIDTIHLPLQHLNLTLASSAQAPN